MPAYFRDGSAQTILCAATLRQKLQIQLSTSPSHSILTPGQPVPAPTLQPRAPGQGSHRSANFEVTGMTQPGKNPGASRIQTGFSALKVDTLTARPTRHQAQRKCVERISTEVFLSQINGVMWNALRHQRLHSA